MIKFIIIIFLVCILLVQSGCSGGLSDWLVKKGFYSQVDKTELEEQKDDRIFTEWKTMMIKEH